MSAAYPITLQVTIDFSNGAVFGTTFLIGDPNYGVLGYNVLGDQASQVVDVSSTTTNISITRGYNLLQDQFDTGRCTFRVEDPNAYFNPQNIASPYYGKLLPLRKVKIASIYSGTNYTLFSGYIDSYNYTYPKDQDTGFVEITCNDGFRLMNMANITTVTGAANGDTTGARINQILNQISWPPSMRNVATGNSLVQNDPASARQALGSLKNVEFVEQGALYCDPSGNVIFKSRGQVEAASAGTPVQFNNDGTTGINYWGITFANDDKLVINSASFQNIGGTLQVASDAASIATYFPHSKQQTNLVGYSDADALNAALAYVATRKTTTIRIDSLTLDLTTPSYAAGIQAALGLDYFQPVQITNYQQAGTSITKNLEVVGVNHEITPKNWKTTFTTSEPIIDAFIIGSSTYGIIGQSVMTY
jgi:hypothetical protein